MSLDKSIGGILADGLKKFAHAKIDVLPLELRILLGEVLQIEPALVLSRYKDVVGDEEIELFAGFVERRLAGEPVYRIIGHRDFFGRQFYFGKDCLEPRPDTELLVMKILDDVPVHCEHKFIDMGCGSGIIAVSILCERKHCNGIAVDVGEGALEATAQNARLLGVGDRLSVIKSSYFDNIGEKVDFIVSNPPYIASSEIDDLDENVKNHDPLLALDGGADGLDAYRVILKQSKNHLNGGGRLYLETGYDQHAAIVQLAQSNHWKLVSAHNDLNGHERVLILEN